MSSTDGRRYGIRYGIRVFRTLIAPLRHVFCYYNFLSDTRVFGHDNVLSAKQYRRYRN